MAFQPPGMKSYKSGDRIFSFVLDSPGVACCSGVQSKDPFENAPLGGINYTVTLPESGFVPL